MDGDVVDGEVVEERESFAPAHEEQQGANTAAVKLEGPGS